MDPHVHLQIAVTKTSLPAKRAIKDSLTALHVVLNFSVEKALLEWVPDYLQPQPSHYWNCRYGNGIRTLWPVYDNRLLISLSWDISSKNVFGRCVLDTFWDWALDFIWALRNHNRCSSFPRSQIVSQVLQLRSHTTCWVFRCAGSKRSAQQAYDKLCNMQLRICRGWKWRQSLVYIRNGNCSRDDSCLPWGIRPSCELSILCSWPLRILVCAECVTYSCSLLHDLQVLHCFVPSIFVTWQLANSKQSHFSCLTSDLWRLALEELYTIEGFLPSPYFQNVGTRFVWSNCNRQSGMGNLTMPILLSTAKDGQFGHR